MNIPREPERWIDKFLAGHKARFEENWPTDSGEINEWKRAWVRAFRAAAASLREATDASADLATRPPTKRRDHIPRVIELIQQQRDKETIKNQPAHSSEAARIRAEAAQAKAEQARAEAVWARLPEEKRREYVARAEANHPHLTQWPQLITQIAVDAMMSAREPGPVLPPIPSPATPPVAAVVAPVIGSGFSRIPPPPRPRSMQNRRKDADELAADLAAKLPPEDQELFEKADDRVRNDLARQARQGITEKFLGYVHNKLRASEANPPEPISRRAT